MGLFGKGAAPAPHAPAPGADVDFAHVTCEEAFKILGASPEGLSAEAAGARLAEYGPNRLPEVSVNPVLRFLGYLNNPLSWAMEAAALLAIALLDYADFALIMGLLLLNAGISFFEESSADAAIKALAGALAPKAKALRGGAVTPLDAGDIVPGDVLLIKFGDVVPADCKILGEGHALGDGGKGEGGGGGGAGDAEEVPMQVDQAALTGESLPVKRFTGGVMFSGSTIKAGERHCLVYATGSNTFFGRAAALISGTNSVANIAKVMTRIGAMCLVTIGLWVVVQLGVQFGYWRHECGAKAGGCPTLTNLLVVIVGGIPIAMPTVLSVTLALGASQLAEHGAIVARMSAVEEMAGMDILCSDKTGTLTLNKLNVDEECLRPMSGLDKAALLRYGALSANVAGDEAIDIVLAASCPETDLAARYRLLKYVPFNPTDKYTMAVLQAAQDAANGAGGKEDKDGGGGGAGAGPPAPGQTFRLMKGAPQAVLAYAWNAAAIKAEVEADIADFASRGLRALGVAYAPGGGAAGAPGSRWAFCGLVPLFDPPRHDTAETIARCHELGVGVKMVTGDQAAIGIETARRLGMGTSIYKIDKLLAAKNGGLVDGAAGFGDLVEAADGFAEVFPEHKFEVVEALQARGHMVGMTGDGVNDAPALKKADVGVAVHGATDAARGAADIVLTEPGLSVIVEAIMGARCIFQRMTTYARYTVAMTFRVAFTFGLLTVAYNWYFPTILIVLLAVFNDGAMIALARDKASPSPTPNAWRLSEIFISGICYGLYLTASTWVLFHLAAQESFFAPRLGLFSLCTTDAELLPHCGRVLGGLGLDADSPASAVYPGFPSADTTALDQCLGEQRYVRGAQLRALLYAQVSISGQALVFVTRTNRHSLADPAGLLTYVAFFGAQIIATLIAALGFGGYEAPPGAVGPCLLCAQSDGRMPRFWSSRAVPVANTEAAFTASVIGACEWVAVAWVWSIIWYVGLDPLKWVVTYAEGAGALAGAAFLRSRPEKETKRAEPPTIAVGGAAANYANPLGRVSMAGRPSIDMLRRASVVRMPAGGVAALDAAGGAVAGGAVVRRVSAPTQGARLRAGSAPSLASLSPLVRLAPGPAPEAGGGGRRSAEMARRGPNTPV